MPRQSFYLAPLLSFVLLSGCAGSRSVSESTAPKALFNVRESGAVGDGKTKDTAAIQAALDRCAAVGGGTVVVPAGDYLTGSLDLKSNTTLRVEKDATLSGSPDLADYPIVKARWEGRWVDAPRALISATKASHIAVVGPGKIAGNPALGGRQMPLRPCVIEPINCTDVRLEGFTATQRQMWTTHPTYCENVVVRHVSIRSIGDNSDGVDIDSCKHVLIEGCDIESGDDCIAIKSGRGMEGVREAHPTEDVLIRDCTFSDNIFACIGIGSETSGGIRGVRIERCTFKQAKTYAIYIKSRPGRGAYIEDISARDLDVATAPGGFLRVNLLNSGIQDPEPVPGDEGIPTAKNFSFTNVKVNCGTLVNATSISPVKPLDGLSIVNVTGTCTNGVSLANIIHAELRDIRVTGFNGSLLGMNNVSGKGLEGAITIPPTAAPPPVLPAAAVAPTAAGAPFALTPLTLDQINGASPFFTVDGKDPVLRTTPPAKLEDLQILRLWPAHAPLQQGDDPAIDIPTLTVFVPPTGKASGAAMIVMPGGAYSHLSPREGLPAARWLASNGITAFILKSRLGTKYQHPAEMDDAQRAIRYVRANAPAWGLDPQRVGIIGFSAGGHLASTAATHFDAGDPTTSDLIERVSSRPDLHILLYPVVTLTDEPNVHKGSRTRLLGNNPAPEIMELLSNEKQVTKDTPPAFIVHSTGDTTVPIANSDQYVAALMKNNIPFVYLREPIGKHGFGITDDWSGQAMAWLHAQKF